METMVSPVYRFLFLELLLFTLPSASPYQSAYKTYSKPAVASFAHEEAPPLNGPAPGTSSFPSTASLVADAVEVHNAEGEETVFIGKGPPVMKAKRPKKVKNGTVDATNANAPKPLSHEVTSPKEKPATGIFGSGPSVGGGGKSNDGSSSSKNRGVNPTPPPGGWKPRGPPPGPPSKGPSSGGHSQSGSGPKGPPQKPKQS